VPAVDTNVARVIERYFIGKRETRNGKRTNWIWEMAAAIVPRNGKRAWAFNQAIMELGARVCVARKPRCPECPVRRGCRTYN
jgi:A/G-specific adenine glycosylase